MKGEKLEKKELFFIIARQFAYIFIFILLFFWSNVVTIIFLIYCLFKQPLEAREVKEIYKRNFRVLDKIL